MTPMIRGNICLNAHPAGCEAAVQAWVARAEAKAANIKANAEKAGKSLPKAVLVLGASTGYGLASRITAAFGYGAATIGVSMERQPSDKKLTASTIATASSNDCMNVPTACFTTLGWLLTW